MLLSCVRSVWLAKLFASAPFVFGGSSFYTDPDTNKQYYQAEHGDFVCVANFGTAMLDIPAKSSKSNEELEFEAMTKKIPPLAGIR